MECCLGLQAFVIAASAYGDEEKESLLLQGGDDDWLQQFLFEPGFVSSMLCSDTKFNSNLIP